VRGARRHGRGWQAAVFVKGAGRAFQAFPDGTEQYEIDEWREQERARLVLQRTTLDEPIAAGTFAADARRYLKAVAAMPAFKDRARDIALWVGIFGTRRRATIKGWEIRVQRDKWLTIGPKRVYNRKVRAWEDKAVPLAGSTVNHRLRALENFYTVLSPQGYNPVRDVPDADEPESQDRALPYELIETILAAMPDVGRGVKGQRRVKRSKSKARLRLMAYTGITPQQMMHLTADDIDVDGPAIRVARRRKGKGAAGGWKPLPSDAGEALRSFLAAGAFGYL
jgi:integrase